jgi:phosphoribosylanthranilate isomerase
MNNIKIKICGMSRPDNISSVAALPVDYLGFIFYERSPRYAGDTDLSKIDLPPHIVKTGVFVDETESNITTRIAQNGLNAVQLHGSETPTLCRRLRERGVSVIKAFNIGAATDLAQCLPYVGACDYFLFDAKTPQHGGAGKQFDWNALSAYDAEVPFFLSGGIGAGDAEQIKALHHKSLYAIDLNSRFETEAGVKNVSLLNQFITTIKTT